MNEGRPGGRSRSFAAGANAPLPEHGSGHAAKIMPLNHG